MPVVSVKVDCPIRDSFRVRQVAGMFDVPLRDRIVEEFSVEVPDVSESWEIGLVVGPSGSGKTTIARLAFGDQLYRAESWPSGLAVVDCLGELPTRAITGLFTAVGFSSAPSWFKPYEVLSNGERFRCDLARALARGAGGEAAPVNSRPVVVFDEFTSVVDRQVARCVSAALAKGIRSGAIPCRFVAVTCHYDVARWLEPDWTVDMAGGTLSRVRLRRPAIELRVHACRRDAWGLFKRHHYLTGSLSPTARCFLALWEDVPVAFCATIPAIGRRNCWRITRLVTLPDYQGMGIGTRLAEWIAARHRAGGSRVRLATGHPAMIRHCQHSSRWRAVAVWTGAQRRVCSIPGYRVAAGRIVASFEFLG